MKEAAPTTSAARQRLLQPEGGDLRPAQLVGAVPVVGRDCVVHLHPTLHKGRQRPGTRASEVVRMRSDCEHHIAAVGHYFALSVVRSTP
jgi:hypothetical protein